MFCFRLWFYRALVILFFIGLFLLLKETFFFHDEWTFIYKILTSPLDFILEPHNGHFWPLFALIYLLEYRLFGLNYPLYQFVLLVFHFSNAYLLYLIICRLTKNQNLGILAFLLFIVNAIYWEVIFASATLPTVLCLFFIALALFNYLKYLDLKSQKYLFFSGLFSLLSSYTWGAGLFFPLLFLGAIFFKKLLREKIRSKEVLVYSLASFISVGSYFLLAGPSSGVVFDFGKVFIFTMTAIKWIIVSFYTSSPGMLTLFGLISAFLSLVFYSVLKNDALPVNGGAEFLGRVARLFLPASGPPIRRVIHRGENKKKKRKFFIHLAKNKLILFFALASFVYLYFLSAVFRYRIDMELARSSRYTYLPLFFLIIINVVILDGLFPSLSKRIKFLFLAYFLFLMVANIYFFRIYYQSWTKTISGPNKEIFHRITQASKEELEIMVYPSTFHSFLTPKQMYFIYQESVGK